MAMAVQKLFPDSSNYWVNIEKMVFIMTCKKEPLKRYDYLRLKKMSEILTGAIDKTRQKGRRKAISKKID